MYLYNVLISHGKFFIVEYTFELLLNIGQWVNVPFGKKYYFGIIIDLINKSIESYHKNLTCIEGFFSIEYMEFLKQFWNNTFTKPNIKPILQVIKKNINFNPIKPKFEQKQQIILNTEQINAVKHISNFFNKFQPVLLWGVTGSGKTEIFFDLISKLQIEDQILILVPEILLLNNLKLRLESIFNTSIIIWNSKTKNKTNYEKVINGSVKIIIGSRSAIFLPFKNLKLIIIDEEHDKSYQQTNYPFYHTKDLCLIWGKILNIPIVFATATPSLESYYEVKQNNYQLVRLHNRYNTNKLPQIEVHKINQDCLFNKEVKCQIINALNNNEQVMIYFNRRGFAPIVYCKLCFSRMVCEICKMPLVFHKRKNGLLCHDCKKLKPLDLCDKCQEPSLTLHGLGIEKLQEIINKEFNTNKSIILSSDYIDNSSEIEKICEKINNEDIQIIIGTQLVTKGHNFKKISLVVVLNMDFMCLDLYFREHLFQNLIQLAGRSGRGTTDGKLLIQTSKPNHWFLEPIINQNYEKFLEEELNNRKISKFPPFFTIFKIFHNKIDIFSKFGNIYNHKDYIILCTNNVNSELFELLNQYGAEKNPIFK